MRYLRGTWMRGGTSKCWLFCDADIAAAGGDVDAVLAAAFGAGDPRQLDGVGGATSTTSKAAIVRRSRRPGIDVDYDFAQVGIESARVEWGSNCGNCATAVGLYAVLAGLVSPHAGHTSVRMRNTNTDALLEARVATPGGVVPETGAAAVPGSAVRGVGVELSFLDPVGASTGALLPTGRPVDRFPQPATLVDAGAPAALFDATAFGRSATDPIDDLVPELVRLRRAAALRMGLARADEPVRHAVPKTGLVSAPIDYVTSDGTPVAADEYDLAVHMLSMLRPHPTIGLTTAVAVAAATRVTDGVVAAATRGPGPTRLRLGTPAGVVEVGIDHLGDRLRAVRLRRAARRIATAEICLPDPAPAATPA